MNKEDKGVAARLPGVTQVGTVFVPVADQDRALEFYLHKLGFEKRVDAIYSNGLRWVEVAPPESQNVIALVSAAEGRPVRDQRTLCAFGTSDIEATHATLLARGVDVDTTIGCKGTSRPGLFSTEITVRDVVPRQFCFCDIDKNRFLMVDCS